jgi:hypothetical protein
MIDTNAILSIAFTMLANFTNVVPVPQDALPRKAEDLQQCLILPSPECVAIHLVHRKGTSFTISYGAVTAYSCPGSFFRLQDPALLPQLEGKTSINSNDAVRLAAGALQRMIKSGSPLSDGRPTIVCPSSERYPFYRVMWPPSEGLTTPTAQVEVDGRTGTIVSLSVRSPAFYDVPFEDGTLRRYCATQQPEPRPGLPRPTTNDVVRAIQSWLALCSKLDLDPGSHTNLENVDWTETYLYNSDHILEDWTRLPASTVCRVQFKNGAKVDAIDGVVFSYACADSYWGRPKRERLAAWGPAQGQAAKDWDNLAKSLDRRIVEKLGVPESVLQQSRRHVEGNPPAQGASGNTRPIVYWHRLPPRPEWDSVDKNMTSLFWAELDLQTGAVKLIRFNEELRSEPIWEALRAPQ